MKKVYLFLAVFLCINVVIYGQEIQMTETASLEQVYEDITESETLLPFNDLNIEFGYVLYKAEINIEEENTELEIENVRDYAVVFLEGKLQGVLTDNKKKITINIAPGKYVLELYVENIGRITYGPEILDNSKGLFGSITIDGEDVSNWEIIPLNIKECDMNKLQFTTEQADERPSFHKGFLEVTNPKDTYLDISGWGMGEVWINGVYLGSYWEEEKQQSIQVSESILKQGSNEVIVFELKNNKQRLMKLSNQPLFK
ncbi:hypothetical protein [Dysgonomonas sp. BGC7]|uniref:hypothetical protein n=1 Tax=Dysgonomonas sp. BGC7 TaxID=1658008 RepID=UPI0006812413|nr:hypothetical protein [Dysgonomonas sp. BGC7]MBD8390300.1 hypothetical protein [Dysgonomonas sp. BGC7]